MKVHFVVLWFNPFFNETWQTQAGGSIANAYDIVRRLEICCKARGYKLKFALQTRTTFD